MLKVLIDDQIFLMHARGGISRYFAELIREFRDHPEWGIEPLTSTPYSVNEHLRSIDPEVANVPGREMSVVWKVSKRLARLPARRARKKLEPDVVHFTYYDPRELDIFPGVPKVITIHDMAPELLAVGAIDEDNPHLAKREYVERADAIICVSEQTKRDLLTCWGPIDVPIYVTPHATNPAFHPDVTPMEPAAPYVLYVGSRDSYKGFATVAAAFAGSETAAAGVQLVTVGGGAFTREEKEMLAELEISDSVRHVQADDSELPRWYAGARAFVYPSTFEGFGIPLLEAMACGTPVVASDIPVFHEVAADAAYYFDVGSSEACRAALDTVVGDEDVRMRLRAAGLARVQEFSWETTARATAEIYQAVARATADSLGKEDA